MQYAISNIKILKCFSKTSELTKKFESIKGVQTDKKITWSFYCFWIFFTAKINFSWYDLKTQTSPVCWESSKNFSLQLCTGAGCSALWGSGLPNESGDRWWSDYHHVKRPEAPFLCCRRKALCAARTLGAPAALKAERSGRLMNMSRKLLSCPPRVRGTDFSLVNVG